MERGAIGLVAVSLVLVGCALVPAACQTTSDECYRWMAAQMDRCHATVQVWTEPNSGGNHGAPSGWMGKADAIGLDAECTAKPRSGFACMKFTVTSLGSDWAGLYWLYPRSWEDKPELDLSGARRVRFWARGETGDEVVEFVTGLETDSCARISLGTVRLGTEWQEYAVDLPDADMSRVKGLFCWVLAGYANPEGAVFYLDDIEFVLTDEAQARRLLYPGTPRMVLSYEPDSPPHPALANACYLYDTSLALMAFLARGTDEDRRRADVLANAIRLASANDREYADGRVRNAYMSGDLLGPDGKARLPGWWDQTAQHWYEDNYQVSTSTGNIGWAALALLEHWSETHDSASLSACVRMAEWVLANTAETVQGRRPGFRAGTVMGPAGLSFDEGKSTEHNIVLWVVFSRLYEATGEERWRRAAAVARGFVQAMWDEREGCFRPGTRVSADGREEIVEDVVPLDAQSLSLLALPNRHAYRAALLGDGRPGWCERNIGAEHEGRRGFAFSTADRRGIWCEGTAQMALSLAQNGMPSEAEQYLSAVERSALASGLGGAGIPAASLDGLATGFGPAYFHVRHLGATAWYVLAERGRNPFWRLPFGDADGDGQTTVRDALALLRAVIGLEDAPPGMVVRGDVDGKPGLSVADVVLVLRGAVGLTRL